LFLFPLLSPQLRQIARENQAWERIIETKRSTTNNFLSAALTDGEISLAKDISSITHDDGRNNSSTRVGRGAAKVGPLSTAEGRTIAVDVREFRSGLPSALHCAGMRLAPLTLTVGDYVVSRQIVCERKAPGDLRQSLGSGRLYTQMEQMGQYYKTPTLLIEFDDSRGGGGDFSLITDDKDMTSEPRTESIISKLAVLTMKFNKARYLWSR